MPVASAYLNDFIAADRKVRPHPARSVFARLAHGFEAMRQREFDRDIAHLIETGGGRLTDSLERQIERRL